MNSFSQTTLITNVLGGGCLDLLKKFWTSSGSGFIAFSMRDGINETFSKFSQVIHFPMESPSPQLIISIFCEPIQVRFIMKTMLLSSITTSRVPRLCSSPTFAIHRFGSALFSHAVIVIGGESSSLCVTAKQLHAMKASVSAAMSRSQRILSCILSSFPHCVCRCGGILSRRVKSA